MTHTTLERAVDTDRMDEPAKQWVNVWRMTRPYTMYCPHCGRKVYRPVGDIGRTHCVTYPSAEIAEHRAAIQISKSKSPPYVYLGPEPLA